MSQRPNVLVILADQLRRSALGCEGEPDLRTPAIDALAHHGARFANACSTTPICVPFRFSFMTGHYAHSRMTPGIRWRMSPAETTLADCFNAGGYETLYVGKWHLFGGLGIRGFETARTLGWLPVPRRHQGRWKHWRGFELRNSPFDTAYFVDDDPTPIPIEGYQTDGLFDVAMTEIDRLSTGESPFCCVLSVEPPHPPFEAPAELEAKWLSRDVTLPPNFLAPPPPGFEERVHGGIGPEARDKLLRQRRIYNAMVENLDQNVARMTAFLRERGLEENTVVVFTSDHGELGGAHCLTGKQFPHEESAGIPLIVAGPGTPAGLVITEPTCTEDFFPTLLGLAGLKPHDDELPGLDLTPRLRGQTDRLDRESVMLEFVEEHRPGFPFHTGVFRAMRSERYLYAVHGDNHGMAPWLLYDLKDDPWQLNNRVNDPGLKDVAAHLHHLLRARMSETDDIAALAPAFGASALNERDLSR